MQLLVLMWVLVLLGQCCYGWLALNLLLYVSVGGMWDRYFSFSVLFLPSPSPGEIAEGKDSLSGDRIEPRSVWIPQLSTFVIIHESRTFFAIHLEWKKVSSLKQSMPIFRE